jgi:hypothetical protein
LVTENGATFRLGAFVQAEDSDTDIWQLYPGQDASGLSSYTPTWLIGKHSSGGAAPAFDGTAQDLSMFTTFVRAN